MVGLVKTMRVTVKQVLAGVVTVVLDCASKMMSLVVMAVFATPGLPLNVVGLPQVVPVAV